MASGLSVLLRTFRHFLQLLVKEYRHCFTTWKTDIYKSYAQFSVVMMEPESQAGKSQIKGDKVALKGDPR